MINNRQKSLIHLAKNQLGLDDDTYREILMQEAGVNSSKDLTNDSFEKVLKRFKFLGFKVKRTEVEKPKPYDIVSQGQLKKMEHLYEDIGLFDKRRQIGFNKRMTGHAWPQTREEANKVIEALKSMIKRGAYYGQNGNGV
ncbi:MAG: hypothetical protein PWQ97_463 [Tepidanaerobacteraceae bacterium]|nr:hypothetical protein [Tepidanaerobacteraceae bacterium]